MIDVSEKYPLFDGFNDESDLRQQFELVFHPLEVGIEIIVAIYQREDYEGRAFVVFRQGEHVYEVNGSHCSCYGLEGQWSAEEVDVKELLRRPSYLGYAWSDHSYEYQHRIRGVLIDALL